MAITTSYVELHKWPRGVWREGEFFGQRKLLCAWDDMASLANEIGNYPESAWPASEYPWGPADALARQIRYEPYDAEQKSTSGSFTDYEYGILTVDYSTTGPIYYGGQMISERMATAQKSVVLDYTRLSWVSASNGVNLRPNEAPNIPFYGLQYERTYHRLLAVPGDVLTFVGFCNANTLTSPVLGLSFAPETLVYTGCRIHAVHQIGAMPAYDVTYLFEYWPFGLNKFFRADDNNPDGGKGWWTDLYVSNPNGGTLKRYRTVNF